MMWVDVMPGEPKNPDRSDLRLISLPSSIAPVVPSPPRARRKSRQPPLVSAVLLPAVSEAVVAGLGLIALFATLVLAGAIWSQMSALVDPAAMSASVPAVTPIARPALPSALPVPALAIDRAESQ